VLALPEANRLRDKQHLRFAQPRGLAQKVSDEFTVSLSRAHQPDCTAPARNGIGGRKRHRASAIRALRGS